MRGCETSTTADESSGRLRLRPRDVYTATDNFVEGIVATSLRVPLQYDCEC